MRKLLPVLLLLVTVAIPATATEITAPDVPEIGQEIMPRNTDSFSDALQELLCNGISLLQPEWHSAVQGCSGILFTAMLFSLLQLLSERIAAVVSLAGVVTIAVIMLHDAGSMISYGCDAVLEICEYGKLLCPVLTTAMSAQGRPTASASLYTGTMVFLTLLNTVTTRLLVPMIYIYLLLSVAQCTLHEETMKRFADTVKAVLCWFLKLFLMVFSTYMSLTGVVSGTTDAAALKATKVAISSVVPVVGSILADASESILVGMSVVKNAAGIYGILAVLSVFAAPFLKIGMRYILLKFCTAVCGLFANKNFVALIEAFSGAMGLLLAMVASGCVLVLISTVCFLMEIG